MKLIRLFCFLGFMFVLVLGLSGQAQAQTYKIKVANWYAPAHPQNVSLTKLKEILAERTDGKIELQIFPNCQLGHETTFIESVKTGTVEMGVPGIMMCKTVPRIAVVELPFLFEGWEHAQKVLRGPIGEEIYAGLIEKGGVRPLAWTVNGFRQISSNKPITKFEDFNGLRLRLPPLPYYIKMGKALGANPITTSFEELFTALEQKVADGQDNPYPTDRASKFYEVQSNILETNHMFSANIWMINEKFFQSMPQEYQTIFLDAVKEAADFNWELSIKKDQEDKKWLQEKGGITVAVPDEAFRKQIQDSQKSVYDWFYNEYPGSKEMAEKIRAAK